MDFVDVRHQAFRLKCLRWVVLLAAVIAPWSYGQEVPEEPGLSLVEAVRLALAHDPAIRLVEAQIDFSRGAVLNSRAAFDPVLSSDLSGSDSRTPLTDGRRSASENLGTSLTWSQSLRSGLSLTPQVSLDREADASGTVNTATVSFALRQSLLRGRGRKVGAAFEQAAEYDLEAAHLDLAHATAERLLAVVSQYWSLKAALLNVEILRSTEESSRALLETTRRLIEAHLTPAADLVQLEADLVLREANRIVGERSLFQELHQLGRELGLDTEQIAALALPADPFPEVDRAGIPEDPSELMAMAVERRADLLAARERLAADEKRLLAAQNALLPRLDLVLTPSYSGLVEGAGTDDFISPLWDHVPGLSTSVNLSWSLPIRNRAAEGDQLSAQTSVRRRQLLIDQSILRIDSQVPESLETVRLNAERLEKLEQAVALFEQTVVNEEKKLRAGTSTLIDVISQRDRLTSALQSRNTARLTLAIALAELRFQTGTLLAFDADDFASVRGEDFTALPPVED